MIAESVLSLHSGKEIMKRVNVLICAPHAQFPRLIAKKVIQIEDMRTRLLPSNTTNDLKTQKNNISERTFQKRRKGRKQCDVF